MAPLKQCKNPSPGKWAKHFHNEKVMAPLKRSNQVFQYVKFLISITKKLWPHWSRNAECQTILDTADFHNEKVMAPLKRLEKKNWLLIITNFHNEKVMAPLKRIYHQEYELHKLEISITKKLWPHWSFGNFLTNSFDDSIISITKKLWPHWSCHLRLL